MIFIINFFFSDTHGEISLQRSSKIVFFFYFVVVFKPTVEVTSSRLTNSIDFFFFIPYTDVYVSIDEFIKKKKNNNNNTIDE